MAGRLLRDEPALSASDYFGPQVSCGVGSGPALFIGDQRELSLYADNAIPSLQYRMALLAAAGDIVAVTERDEEFEAYLRTYVGVHDVTFIETGTHPTPVSVRCREDPILFSKLKRALRDHGAMTIIPYLCTGNTWRLAQTLSMDTDASVQVCGPPPRLSKRVNDKIWFSNRARQLFGDNALPPTYAAYGPAAAAAHIARFAKTAARMVIKVPDSAGSMGNVVLESTQVSDLTLGALRAHLLKLLYRTGWHGSYPVLAGVWDDNVHASPSLQMWIPNVAQGAPLIEDIFEQRVQGAEGKFVGAVRSHLDPETEGRLVKEALQFAHLFQQLGYFGRCSLDCVLTRSCENGRQVHWIECNGRWGGVSIPMTLVNGLGRVAGGEGLVIVQQVNLGHQYRTTQQTIELLSDLLYERGISERGLLLLAPTSKGSKAAVNFAALAPNQEEAAELAERATSRMRS
ncbi:MAG: hypothetical protein GY947_02170 [Rhodobacteraceae bacterium]|nr:hypothetical protein [Paracoccaceae bacterium]